MHPSRLVLIVLAGVALSCSTSRSTQQKTTATKNAEDVQFAPEPEVYRASYTLRNDLVHTKLELVPDWSAREVNGKATITLHPHFYATDSLVLNARGMDIHEVSMAGPSRTFVARPYSYTNNLLRIQLDTIYAKDQNYTVFIRYTAKPEELKKGGSAAIREEKGFYFINPDNTDPDRPKQFWTQGETESNSAWFPTIESPAQRMTQEIYLTVDSSFKTISNGLLLSSTPNADGTRTDYWKQSLPAAPYLTMVAAGDFAVVKDRWRNLEVNYYVDKPYEKYARMTFGKTPEMIEFFSTLLGVDFPWEKYHQVVVHDYISGAMENTTAVVHGTNMQQDSGEYMDGNYEDYISHELSHHWFGDLVTCESWSNITLNEGFANYAEYLWDEHKYGRDEADCSNQAEQSLYLRATSKHDPALFRTDYNNREDVYDAVSYQKGGRVLHMLRNYVGDEAFFASLHLYLTTHRFSSVEIDDLRLAFEKVTGEDLNWFFSQWFDKGGRPSLAISYQWNDSAHRETVTLQQTQNFSKNPLYRLPMFVDVYCEGKKDRHSIVLDSAHQEFSFNLPSKPDLVNVDAEKMLLCSKKDNKSYAEFIFQFYHAPLYLDRYEAVAALCNDYKTGTAAAGVISDALRDKSWRIRLTAIDNIGELAKNDPDPTRTVLMKLANKDSSSNVREAAYKALGKYYPFAELDAFFEDGLYDPSYQVVARIFKIISDKNTAKGFEVAARLEADSSADILSEIGTFYAANPDGDRNPFYERAIRKCRGWGKMNILRTYTKYLVKQDEQVLEKGIDILGAYSKTNTSNHMFSALGGYFKSLKSELTNRIHTKEEELDSLQKKNEQLSAKVNLDAEIEKLKICGEKINTILEDIEARKNN